MLKRIQSKIGAALAALVSPYLAQGSERTVLAPVVTAQCMAHHYLVESLIHCAVRDPASAKLLKDLAREAVERCHFELYGKEAHAAAGIIEDLIDRLDSWPAPERSHSVG
jgi:hypothetical protein